MFSFKPLVLAAIVTYSAPNGCEPTYNFNQDPIGGYQAICMPPRAPYDLVNVLKPSSSGLQCAQKEFSVFNAHEYTWTLVDNATCTYEATTGTGGKLPFRTRTYSINLPGETGAACTNNKFQGFVEPNCYYDAYACPADCKMGHLSGGAFGAVPASQPGQTPPGYITAIYGDGSNKLNIIYTDNTGAHLVQYSFGTNFSGIQVTGGWSGSRITSLEGSGNQLIVNQGQASQGSVTFNGVTVAGSIQWNGTSAGAGFVTADPSNISPLNFDYVGTMSVRGYNSTSGAVTGASFRFTGVCNFRQ